MKLYGIPNCNTVKKACSWLEQHGIAYGFHDFKKHGVDAVLLQHWLTQYPWEKLVNRSGLTWRGLEDTIKNNVVDNASAMALMQIKPSLIKRPVLVKNDRIIALGFSEKEYAYIFPIMDGGSSH